MNSFLVKLGIVACLVLGFTQGHAEILELREGQKASFVVDQDIDLGVKTTDLGEGKAFSKMHYEFDARILKGQNYPYEVELIFTRIQLKESFSGCCTPDGEVDYEYDSSSEEKTEFGQLVDKLIGKRIRFIVKEDSVVEKTNFLENLEFELEILAAKEIVTQLTSASLFKILPELFHCNGCDLQAGNTYSLNPNQVFGNLEQDDSDFVYEESTQTIVTEEKSFQYTVEQAGAEKSVASWDASLSITMNDGSTIKEVMVGDVIWDMKNPLNQNRTSRIESISELYACEDDEDSFGDVSCKYTIQQKISSK